jgi:hypothetical protein
MDKNQKKEKIAEICGWKKVEQPKNTIDRMGCLPNSKKKEYWFNYQLPDYCCDLNAIHHAIVEFLDFKSVKVYNEFADSLEKQLGHKMYWLASAEDLSEAFLKTSKNEKI